MEIDYEKEYKAMVQRARELHETGNELTKRQMEIVCPQLRESEDERIRKLLVWQVYRNIEDETNDLAQSVYDGIKGHDPDLEESIEDWKKCLSYLEKQKPENVSATTMAPSCWEVEQKEQKPLITGNDFGWIDELKHDLKHPEELDQKVQEVLKKRQKPVERSEEDEDKLEQCIRIVSGWEKDYDIVKSPYSNFLKALRPSWKPSKEQMRR